MNPSMDRFQPPDGREEHDPKREEEIERERADAWHDQRDEREEKP